MVSLEPLIVSILTPRSLQTPRLFIDRPHCMIHLLYCRYPPPTTTHTPARHAHCPSIAAAIHFSYRNHHGAGPCKSPYDYLPGFCKIWISKTVWPWSPMLIYLVQKRLFFENSNNTCILFIASIQSITR